MGPTHGSLQVEGLLKRMEGFTLEATFEVPAGVRAAIEGPSGSGKTTLLRLLAGLDPVDQGKIRLAGRDLTGLEPQAREIGYVFQDAALFPSMSVAENAAFGLRMRGVGARERRARVLPWLERVGLASRADDGVSYLSGGERQRVAFVRALAWKPQLVLLDEPFSALDANLRASLRQTLLDLHREWPVPLILVTHDREDVEALATAIFALEQEAGGVRRLSVRRYLD